MMLHIYYTPVSVWCINLTLRASQKPHSASFYLVMLARRGFSLTAGFLRYGKAVQITADGNGKR